MSADRTVTFLVGPRVAWRETGGEIVLLDSHGWVYFGLNPSAARLWKRLLDGASHDDLTAVLTAGGQVPDARARSDVDAFLAELDRLGLLERR